MALNQGMEQYLLASRAELQQLIRDLCAIPAPSHHEQARAAFCEDWFRKNGCTQAYTDDALNVICPWNMGESNDLWVFMAHTDTVFPDTQPMPFCETNGRMYSPGVTDDTANLAVMMICARYMIRNYIPGETGALFIANSCEEGLGNLKGSRRIVECFGSRIRALITLDGTSLPAVVNRAVGSHRYRITARTEGGHSFTDFGRPNAIHCLAGLIQDLYAMEIPEEAGSSTTFNVGMISGGTSVNTIAQHAEMLYEYRSDSLNCLKEMENRFYRTLLGRHTGQAEFTVEKIGDRPCAGNVDPEEWRKLTGLVRACIRETLNADAVFTSGSTDANAALSAGIPALCISVCNGGGCHTREEWLDISSLDDGCRLFMSILGACFPAEAN